MERLALGQSVSLRTQWLIFVPFGLAMALMVAVAFGEANQALTLVDSPLCKASRDGNVTAVLAAMAAGNYPDSKSMWLGLAAGGHLIKAHSAVFVASKEGHLEALTALLQAGASPETGATLGPAGLIERQSPLHVAVENGHVAVVEALLKAGANPGLGLQMFNGLSLIHISEPTRLLSISYAVFCLKKKKDQER
eukprot:TRINITY_DN48871_c0_g1_i1.p2 TRINITY_DN48871_c0_g1~~TRINITY_DN48871_c0_g1_i1.p2  ORF type:complete len:194 (+),score=48.62 TRINITY_DN48871_c0_g1_i1:3-584(+)